jgi:hypothetical protein
MTIVGDIVFPELLFEGRLLAWWIILIGLALELPFVRLITGLPLKKCVLADLAMNAVSTAVGVVLIPVLGLGWELGGPRVLGDHRFDLLHWSGSFLLAVVVNSVIELTVLVLGFKQQFNLRSFLWLFLANSLSVGLALWSLFHDPPRLYHA